MRGLDAAALMVGEELRRASVVAAWFSLLDRMHFTSIANDVPSGLDCDLYALLELGPDVFVDPYELEQQHWLWGTNDLELPVAAVDPRGSVLLLNLTRHAPSSLSVPLHARYPLPSEAKHIVRVPQPSFFWACDTAQAAREYAREFHRVL